MVVAPMVELEKDKSSTQNESVTLFTSYIPPSALSQLLAHNLPEAHVSPSGARCIRVNTFPTFDLFGHTINMTIALYALLTHALPLPQSQEPLSYPPTVLALIRPNNALRT